MAIRPNQNPPGNPYDPDDPDNYMNRSRSPEDSPVFAWILGGIVGVATIVGLFVAQESPLTDPLWQTTENAPSKPPPTPTLPN
jgi:hypothetical protein